MVRKSQVRTILLTSISTTAVVSITILAITSLLEAPSSYTSKHGTNFVRRDFPQLSIVTFRPPAVTVLGSLHELIRRQDPASAPAVPPPNDPQPATPQLAPPGTTAAAPTESFPPAGASPVPATSGNPPSSAVSSPIAFLNSTATTFSGLAEINSVDRSPNGQKARVTSLINQMGVASFGLMAVQCQALHCDRLYPQETVVYTPGPDGRLSINATITGAAGFETPNPKALNGTMLADVPLVTMTLNGTAVKVPPTEVTGNLKENSGNALMLPAELISWARKIIGQETVTITQMVSNVTITETRMATITGGAVLVNITEPVQMVTVTQLDGAKVVPVPIPIPIGGGEGGEGGGETGGAGSMGSGSGPAVPIVPGPPDTPGEGADGGNDPARETITVTATVTSTATLNETVTVLTTSTSTTLFNETTTSTTLFNTTATFNFTSTYNTTTTKTKTKKKTKTTTWFATAPPLPDTPFILEIVLPADASDQPTEASVTPGAGVLPAVPAQTGVSTLPIASEPVIPPPAAPARFRMLKRLFRRQHLPAPAPADPNAQPAPASDPNAAPPPAAVPNLAPDPSVTARTVPFATGTDVVPLSSEDSEEPTGSDAPPDPPSSSFFLKLSSSQANLQFTGESYSLQKKLLKPVDASVFRYYNTTLHMSSTVPTGGEDYTLIYAARSQNQSKMLFNGKDVINFAPEVEFLEFDVDWTTGDVRIRGGSWVVCGEGRVVSIGPPAAAESTKIPPPGPVVAPASPAPPPARFRRRQDAATPPVPNPPQSLPPQSVDPPACTAVSVRAIGV